MPRHAIKQDKIFRLCNYILEEITEKASVKLCGFVVPHISWLLLIVNNNACRSNHFLNIKKPVVASRALKLYGLDNLKLQ